MIPGQGFRLCTIDYRGLRNLTAAQLEFQKGLNIFVGDNGTGKSALLEAVHLLASGKSFRAARLKSAVAWGDPGFVLRGHWSSQSSAYRVRSSHRFDGKESDLKFGSTSCTRVEILKQFPLLFVGAESLKFFEEGPGFRRRQLDIGGFHVEHSYLDSWRRYRRALSQRNAILRSSSIPSNTLRRLLSPWDEEMANYAQHLHRSRSQFSTKLQAVLTTFTGSLGLPEGLSLRLKPGWDPDVGLQEQLEGNLEKDLSLGYSLRGPHRDDLVLKLNNRGALNAMSRGQQKAFMLAFFLSMSQVMAQKSGRYPLLLFDDLAAELDNQHQKTLLSYLAGAPFQSLVTLVEARPEAELPDSAAMFHVKHGAIYRCYNGPIISNGPDPHPHVEFNERYL